MPAVIFDLDDTLYPPSSSCTAGSPPSPARGRQLRRAGDGRLRDAALRAHGTAATAASSRALRDEHRLDTAIVPDARATFRAHRPQLWLQPTRAATRCSTLRARRLAHRRPDQRDPVVQRRKVAALGLEALVDHVVYAEEHAPAASRHASRFSTRCAGCGVLRAACRDASATTR